MKVSGQLHTPAALPQGKSPWYPLDRRLGGPRTGLDVVVRRKIPSPYTDTNPDHPACSPAHNYPKMWILRVTNGFHINFPEL